MQALVDLKVYQIITVYDYQALCEEYTISMDSAADILVTVIWKHLKLIFKLL